MALEAAQRLGGARAEDAVDRAVVLLVGLEADLDGARGAALPMLHKVVGQRNVSRFGPWWVWVALVPIGLGSWATLVPAVERRKILSLRIAMVPQRLEGAKLMEALLAESLQHGKYGIFHRLHSDGSIVFSVASMVEPGTFELDKMGETLYPGITMFTQLPGPVPGMHALNEVIACARRLQATLGGTWQDERGVPLTVHRIERMRQEVREFERPPAGGGRGAGSQSAHL